MSMIGYFSKERIGRYYTKIGPVKYNNMQAKSKLNDID